MSSEAQLKTKFDVSTQPIQIAFNRLIEMRLVRSSQGAGYFVNSKMDNNVLFCFSELHTDQEAQYFAGPNISSEGLFKQYDHDLLKMNDEYRCVIVRRYLNKKLAVYEVAYMPVALTPNFDQSLVRKHGIFRYLEQIEDLLISYNRKIICAAPDEYKELLQKEFQSEGPFMLEKSIVYDDKKRLVEYSLMFHLFTDYVWEVLEFRKNV